MRPDRKEIVNGYKVEEYIWNGKLIVYIDGIKSEQTFEAAIESCQAPPGDQERRHGEN